GPGADEVPGQGASPAWADCASAQVAAPTATRGARSRAAGPPAARAAASASDGTPVAAMTRSEVVIVRGAAASSLSCGIVTSGRRSADAAAAEPGPPGLAPG